jgi:Xaa-Pro dipeptidase
MLLRIQKDELLERQKRLTERLQSEKFDGAVLFSVTDIFYLTGFYFIPTERPMAFFIDPEQKTHLFVPRLEHQHAEEYAAIDYVHSYKEYPGTRHPMEFLSDELKEAGLDGKIIGYDAAGYGSPNGYSGPLLEELIQAKKFVSILGWVEEMRYIKSEAEIELIKESARWGNLAHSLLVKYTKPGVSEIEIESKATTEATLMMVETLGRDYKPNGNTANAFFRGQIGENAAFPHAVTQNAVFKKGDLFVTQAAADVWGYKSELERTMFVQEVSKEQEKYFNYMLEAQTLAMDTIKPGVPFSTVDKAVKAYFKEQGVDQYVRHHIGHNIGLLGHEAPFFDIGDDRIIEPGMVVTIEPGLYVKGLGGFRHSDTALITKDGLELITYYPRDLESLITF